MAQYPKTLPTKNMPNAAPTRKIFSSVDAPASNILVTSTSKQGDLAFLRSQGVTHINLTDRKG